MPSREREAVSRNSNEGEGSRTAARRYGQGVRRTVRSGRVEEGARRAVKALEGAEGPALRRAEAKARLGSLARAKRRAVRPAKH
jgi:hypothetical protein